MALSVKQKIRSGTLFLFFMLLLSGAVGIYYVVRLKEDENRILRNNYESLDYCQSMLGALDLYESRPGQSVHQLESALGLEERNITEPGESDAVQSIRRMTGSLKGFAISGLKAPGLIDSIHRAVHGIIRSNMLAIERKNRHATETADQALLIIGLLAGVFLLVGVSFTYNFPSVLTAPIAALTSGIQQISRRNYKFRIHIDNKDEFGDMADAFNSMAERLETFENSNLNKIIFEKTRAEAVINSLKDASIGIDKNNVVLFANDQALQLLGLRSTDIVSKTVDEMGARNDLFRFLIEEKNNLPFKIVVDQRENYFIKEVLEISQEDQNSRVIILRNITSFKELDVARTNFIATISHELKTPLASSDISLRLLEDARVSTLTAEQQELINNLRLDNQRMLRILSELLNMAQVETGKIRLDLQTSDPAKIAEGAIANVQQAARERQVSIINNYAENLPLIMADADKTGWVLNNLLTNAIRHSPPGANVTVGLTLNGEQVIFSVKDEGPGIAEEYQSKLFDRFFTVPGSRSNGTGLGLSISKEFIEAQAGSIGVQSKPGAGSMFSFGLPVVR